MNDPTPSTGYRAVSRWGESAWSGYRTPEDFHGLQLRHRFQREMRSSSGALPSVSSKGPGRADGGKAGCTGSGFRELGPKGLAPGPAPALLRGVQGTGGAQALLCCAGGASSRGLCEPRLPVP